MLELATRPEVPLIWWGIVYPIHDFFSALVFFCNIYDQKYIRFVVYCLKQNDLFIQLMSHFVSIFYYQTLKPVCTTDQKCKT